jgi:hypothetical protein
LCGTNLGLLKVPDQVVLHVALRPLGIKRRLALKLVGGGQTRSPHLVLRRRCSDEQTADEETPQSNKSAPVGTLHPSLPVSLLIQSHLVGEETAVKLVS